MIKRYLQVKYNFLIFSLYTIIFSQNFLLKILFTSSDLQKFKQCALYTFCLPAFFGLIPYQMVTLHRVI